jgi:HEAT repeats
MDPRDPRSKLHVRVGLAFVKTLRPALYVLLVASALVSFWGGGELFGRRVPHWAVSAAPTLFGIFLAVFSVYRIALVRARRYPAATGLFQIGLGALVVVLLLPGVRQGLQRPPAGQGDAVPELIRSPDPRVRALAAEVAGARSGGERYAALLLRSLDDPDAAVRASARAALSRLAGTDVGAGLEEGAAARRWREEAQIRGWTR